MEPREAKNEDAPAAPPTRSPPPCSPPQVLTHPNRTTRPCDGPRWASGAANGDIVGASLSDARKKKNEDAFSFRAARARPFRSLSLLGRLAATLEMRSRERAVKERGVEA